jgi:hypothetical protein
MLSIAAAFNHGDIKCVASAHNSPLVDLGKFAKLKGAVSDMNAPLSDIAGSVLTCNASYEDNSQIGWDQSPSDTQLSKLVEEVDCVWQLYSTLLVRNSVGLPLRAEQIRTPGQLVTFVVACKPVAEGYIVGHTGTYNAVMDLAGNTKPISISDQRALIKLTKLLVPGHIHALHGQQTLQWIFDRGSHAVVTWSQLRSRSSTPPLPSSSIPGFSSPILQTERAKSVAQEEFSIDLPASLTSAETTNDLDNDDGDNDDIIMSIEVCFEYYHQ